MSLGGDYWLGIHQKTGASVTTRQFWTVGLLLATTLPLAGGCSNAPSNVEADSTTVTSAAYRDLGPREYLQAVFARYKTAETYCDNARVRLSYHLDGRSENQFAPLSVCLDRRNFYVTAYSLRCYCDSRRTLSWICDEATNDFDHQVSVTEVPKSRQDWEKLTLDPIFQQHLSAGLAGPPPQLDWLFATEPMKRLFDDQHTFTFADLRTVDGEVCQSVIVQADASRYTFWIDRDQGIIRRVELPPVYSSIMPANPPQEMMLTVELTGATFRQSSEPPHVDSLPSRPHYVVGFVPLPPEQPNRELGSQMEPALFERLPTFAKSNYDRNFRTRAWIIVVAIGEGIADSQSRLLASWNSQLPEGLAACVQVVHVDRESVQWLDSLGLEMAGESAGGIAIVTEDRTIAWTSGLLHPEQLPAFGSIVADVLSGVDVARRLRDDWQAADNAYRAELGRRRPPD